MENNVLQQLKENIAKVMIGNERTIELVLTCLVAKGHILLEDVPGTGDVYKRQVLGWCLAHWLCGS